MLQPVLVILDVPDNTQRSVLGHDLEIQLRMRGYEVKQAIPLAYTLDIPEGSISV